MFLYKIPLVVIIKMLIKVLNLNRFIKTLIYKILINFQI
jgi:hypothetical protein